MANESSRQPANDPAHIEALKLRAELERSRVGLQIAAQQAKSMQMLAEAQAMTRSVALRPGSGMTSVSNGVNTVYTLRFALGSTKLSLPLTTQQALIKAASQGAQIVLRGRTDSERDDAANARIARLRAEAAKVLLVQGGVPAGKIRATWQGAGDTVASNETVEGRALNRRVEIEVYAAQPEPSVIEQPATRAAMAPN
jgi:outer membrane protein OmpA-like peptidoglycan-associated protein